MVSTFMVCPWLESYDFRFPLRPPKHRADRCIKVIKPKPCNCSFHVIHYLLPLLFPKKVGQKTQGRVVKKIFLTYFPRDCLSHHFSIFSER